MTQEAAVPPGLWGRIEQLIDRKIGQALRSAPLRNARVSGAGSALTVSDGAQLRVLYSEALGGGMAVLFGDLVDPTTGVPLGTGLVVQGPDGNDIAQFRTDVATSSTVAQLWGQGRSVVSVDPAGGLGRPLLSHPGYVARVQDFPQCTAVAFETIWRAKHRKLAPRLYVEAWGWNDTAGATGELRVMVNGAQLGATQATGNGLVTGHIFGPATVAGAMETALSIELQARLASGGGSVRSALSRVESWPS